MAVWPELRGSNPFSDAVIGVTADRGAGAAICGDRSGAVDGAGSAQENAVASGSVATEAQGRSVGPRREQAGAT
jgi:hypothetical protein